MKNNNPILELQSIAHFAGPQLERQINQWIKNNIGQASFAIKIFHPEDPKHQQHNFEMAMHSLGKVIAEKANMFPTFEPVKDGFEC